jgi:hypothetical protein
VNPLHQQAIVPDSAMLQLMISDNRCTGKSTAIALETIANAIKQPFTPITIRDHFPSTQADEHLAHMIEQIVRRLELKMMTFKRTFVRGQKVFTIQFGDKQ